jgi:hypothetical protein
MHKYKTDLLSMGVNFGCSIVSEYSIFNFPFNVAYHPL